MCRLPVLKTHPNPESSTSMLIRKKLWRNSSRPRKKFYGSLSPDGYSPNLLASGAADMLEIQNLSKLFSVRGDSAVKAIDEVSFNVEPGEFFTLLGPSGCGKTTTLRCVAGLERPQEGKIQLRGRTVFDSSSRVFVAPNQRNIGMVFQSYAVWPHLTVFHNVAFPLKAGGQRNFKILRDKVEHALDLVGLSGFEDRPATQLSGGQQQRVAL